MLFTGIHSAGWSAGQEGPTWLKPFPGGHDLTLSSALAFVVVAQSCWFFGTSWTVARQAPLFSSFSQSLLKFMFIELVMYLTISSSATTFSSCPWSFQASRSFPISRLFISGGQSIGAPASGTVFPMSIQGWFPLELNDWISLLSKGLSKIFSSTTIKKHQFFATRPSLWSNTHIRT